MNQLASISPPEFQPGRTRVLVLGAGVMGPGIAQVFAEAGYEVTLGDVNAAVLARGGQALQDSLQLKVELELISPTSAQEAYARVGQCLFTEPSFGEYQLIIEAVTEKEAVKRALFAQLQAHANPHAVVWSNTSTLDVFALAPPELCRRLLVAHWFAPPQILPLIEVVSSPSLEPAILEGSVACLRELGKTPVLLKKFVPGFLINRFLRALGREAFHLIEEDIISIEDLDIAVRTSLAPRMQILGILQRYDFTGLNLSLQNLANPQMIDAPVDLSPRVLRERSERGELGITTGRGFYDYGDRDFLSMQRERDKQLWQLIAGLGELVTRPKPL